MSVLEAPTVKDGTFVKVLPYLDDVENIKGDLIDNLLGCVLPKYDGCSWVFVRDPPSV